MGPLDAKPLKDRMYGRQRVSNMDLSFNSPFSGASVIECLPISLVLPASPF